MTNGQRPKTIQIHLPSGDPTGIRVAELTTSIVRVIEVPRTELATFLKMPEAEQVGLYFLVGGDSNDEIYIGQSNQVGSRLIEHNKKKDWERALILVSVTHNLTQTHVLYLEYKSIQSAKACERYSLSNGNNGQKHHILPPQKADCDELHAIGSVLLATLGYPIFEPLVQEDEEQRHTRLYCTRSNVEAQGYYTNEGMIVLKGSKAPYLTTKTSGHKAVAKRDELLERGSLIRLEGDVVVFKKDILFKSPSGASSTLVLGASNGWTDWKTADGLTLREFYGRDL